MKEGYLPKDQRKTILLLSDDIRLTSGVGVQSKNIVLNTAHHYNWVNVGGAVKHPEAGKAYDLSTEVNDLMGLTDSNVKVIPSDGYGNPSLIRSILSQEKIDAIVHFTDPRYWIWLYRMENELRQKMPMIFYTIWDDLPYPMYNRSYYESDDMLLCISKQTKNLVKNVLKDKPKEDWAVQYLPHGIDPSQFYPIVNGDEKFKLETFKEKMFEGEKFDFVMLWNSRNIRRKNMSDIILAWRTFLDQLPVEQAKKCCLLMHTEKVSEHGTDLPAVVATLCDPEIHKVKFSDKKLNDKEMNYLFNCSDAHIFMTDNEGWGLGLTESLTAGRMIIAPVQGGMQDQMRFEDENGDWIDFSTEHPSNADGKYKKCGKWAMPLFPKTRSIKGSPLTPYIFASQVSIEDAAIALMKVYKMGPEERERRGLAGREWVMSKEARFTAEGMGERFIENINLLFEKWKPRKRFDLIKADDKSFESTYNPHPISLTPEFLKEIQSI
jgi:glycosyltransferase involved in cell wall biosynthesis